MLQTCFLSYAPDEKLKSSVDSCLQDNLISARGLALITGQIISLSCAVGNVTRLLTRNFLCSNRTENLPGSTSVRVISDP